MTISDQVGLSPEQMFDDLRAEAPRFTQEADGPWLFAGFVFEVIKGEVELLLPEHRTRVAVPRIGHMTYAEQLVTPAYDSPDADTQFRETLTRARDGRFFITRSPGYDSRAEPLKHIVHPRAKSHASLDKAFQAVKATEHWQGVQDAMDCQREGVPYMPRRPFYFDQL